MAFFPIFASIVLPEKTQFGIFRRFCRAEEIYSCIYTNGRMTQALRNRSHCDDFSVGFGFKNHKKICTEVVVEHISGNIGIKFFVSICIISRWPFPDHKLLKEVCDNEN